MNHVLCVVVRRARETEKVICARQGQSAINGNQWRVHGSQGKMFKLAGRQEWEALTKGKWRSRLRTVTIISSHGV